MPVEKINTKFEGHTNLEEMIIAHAEGIGYSRQQHGVEHLYRDNKDVLAKIGRINAPSTQAIRSAPDMILTHESGFCIYADAKAKESADYADICIELTPFLAAIKRAQGGCVNTLYCCYVPKIDKHAGIIASCPPKIREIAVDKGISAGERLYIETVRDLHFPGVEIKDRYLRSGVGSGDPCIFIDGSVVENLPDWRDLLESRVEAQAKTPHDWSLAAKIVKRGWDRTVQRVVAHLRGLGWTITPPNAEV